MTYLVTNKTFLFPGFCAFKSDCVAVVHAVAALTRAECRKTANIVIMLILFPLGPTCATIVVTGTHIPSCLWCKTNISW